MTGKRIAIICLVLLALAAVYVVTRPPKPEGAADLLAERYLVQCRHPGEAAKEVPVSQHEPADTGDEINTNQTGLGILTFADFLRVEIIRSTGLQVKAAPDPNAPAIVKLYLALGTTIQELQERAGERVEVTTETDWATIRAIATAYLVSVDEDEVTWVVVSDGEAEVEAQEQTVVVRAGQATWVEPRKAPRPAISVEMGAVDDWVNGVRQAEEVGSIKSVIYPMEDEWGVIEIAAGEPIRIGFAAGLSGGWDVLSIDELRGAELALKDRSEIKDFNVELMVEDDMCNAEGGQAVANKFVADPTIVAVVGHACSRSCIPASKIYEQHHYTMVSPSCTNPSLTNPDFDGTEIFNRVCWNDAIQGPAVASFVKDVLGVDRVATIHDGSPYAEQLGQEFAKAFEAIGGQIVAREAVNEWDTDMRPVLTRIKAGNPGLIYWSGIIEDQGMDLASQRADVGMENVVFMGANVIKTDEFVKAVGDMAEGTYAGVPDLAEAGPALPKFLEAYKATYREDPIELFHAHAYDAFMVIANAIEKVAEVDADGNLFIGRERLRDAIRSTSDYQGLSGKISCDDNGDCGTGSVAFWVVKGGEWVAAAP